MPASNLNETLFSSQGSALSDHKGYSIGLWGSQRVLGTAGRPCATYLHLGIRLCGNNRIAVK